MVSVKPIKAVPWPPYTYCVSQGYDTETVGKEHFCVFPNGSKCEMRAFYDGKCGQEFVKEVECSTGKKLPGMECCPGYISRPDMKVASDGSCQQLDGTSADCLPCGNKICDERENICNCPEDCKNEISPEVVSEINEKAIPKQTQSSNFNVYFLGAGLMIILTVGVIIFINKK